MHKLIVLTTGFGAQSPPIGQTMDKTFQRYWGDKTLMLHILTQNSLYNQFIKWYTCVDFFCINHVVPSNAVVVWIDLFTTIDICSIMTGILREYMIVFCGLQAKPLGTKHNVHIHRYYTQISGKSIVYITTERFLFGDIPKQLTISFQMWCNLPKQLFSLSNILFCDLKTEPKLWPTVNNLFQTIQCVPKICTITTK